MSYIIVRQQPPQRDMALLTRQLATIRAKPGQVGKILDRQFLSLPYCCSLRRLTMTDLTQVSEEVRASEPETVQYQITQSDEDENEILIWEEVSVSVM